MDLLVGRGKKERVDLLNTPNYCVVSSVKRFGSWADVSSSKELQKCVDMITLSKPVSLLRNNMS